MSVEPESTQHASSAVEGGHPLTIAANAGFGPLSEQNKEAWHGDSTPCASCGQLNRRNAEACDHCGQDLAQAMLEKMASHSGPWFVYDNIRPFPGVSLERILRLIQRGVLTRASIVRGPTTYYQWRFAAETPLIARYLGWCWQCHTKITPEERYCPKCKAVLDGHYRRDQVNPDASTETPTAAPSGALDELSKVVTESQLQPDLAQLSKKADRPLGKAPLIFFGIAIVVVIAVVTFVKLTQKENHSATSPSEPAQSYYDRTLDDSKVT